MHCFGPNQVNKLPQTKSNIYKLKIDEIKQGKKNLSRKSKLERECDTLDSLRLTSLLPAMAENNPSRAKKALELTQNSNA